MSSADNSKKYKNLLSLVKSSTKETVSSIFVDSDAISHEDFFNGKSLVEPNQEEEYSNFTHSFMIPTQTKATSEDK